MRYAPTLIPQETPTLVPLKILTSRSGGRV